LKWLGLGLDLVFLQVIEGSTSALCEVWRLFAAVFMESFVLPVLSKMHCHSWSSAAPSCPSLIIMQVERRGLDLLLLNGQGFTLKSC